MSDTAAIPNRAKKGVGLSGVTAGNTALCTVGRTGNDLHYRGYDILDVAESCEFEEIAHLLVHGALPTRAELTAYKAKLRALRGLPASLKQTLEALPPASHPMDVMRTAVSALGCALPEKEDQNQPGARDIIDRLMACLGSALLYWFHYAHNGKRIDVETDDDSIGGHFLHLLHGKPPSEMFARAMHTSLILYAEHEFNASTFTCRVVAGTGADMYSAITAGIGALRGPKHGGANEVSFDIQSRYANPDEAEADIRKRVANREVIIGFGHAVYTIADPRNKVIKEVAHRLSQAAGFNEVVRGRRQNRGDDERRQEDVRQPRLVQRHLVPHARRSHCDVHAAVRDRAYVRLGCARHRAAHRQQVDSPDCELHWPRECAVRADRQTRLTRFVEVGITAAISLSRRFCVTSPHRISRACIFFVELRDDSIAFC
jgi:2-methylcitrate synthase